MNGPLKAEAVEDLRSEIRKLLPWRDSSLMEIDQAQEDGRLTGLVNLDVLERIRDPEWVADMLYDDSKAWQEAQEGAWKVFMFGVCLPPGIPEWLDRNECLDSFFDLDYSSRKVVRAEDNYGTFPPVCPGRVTTVGTHKAGNEVFASATVNDWLQVQGMIFYHPEDPDASLWAAIQESRMVP